MPHLAPLNWIFLSFLFYLNFYSFFSLIWWFQLPYFPSLSFYSFKMFLKWKW
uniref:ATP synthase subunit 8 n=1 Tax=Galathealinum brachiosum TaxID=53701 RepID=Q9MNK0_9ANNE|nr:ATP synthase subunit 8 [Galathealinum brachiosum]